MSPVDAWAVVDCIGDLVEVSFFCTKEDASESWARKVGGNWPMHERNGYRVIRVTITAKETP